MKMKDFLGKQSPVKTSNKKLREKLEKQQKHNLEHSKYHIESPTKNSPSKQQKMSATSPGQKNDGIQVAFLYNEFKTSQGNLIWSGASNLSFNQFKQHFLNDEDLILKDVDQISNQTQQSLKAFNNSTFSMKDISQKSIYVKSGVGINAIKSINKDVLAKFPNKQTAPLNQQQGQYNDFITYSYLFKALEYEHPFERQPGMLWFGQPCPGTQSKIPYMVQAFSAITQECLSQVKLIDYHDPYNFIVKFEAKPLNNSNFKGLDFGHFNTKVKEVKSMINVQEQSKPKDLIYILSFNEKQVHHGFSVKQIIEKVKQVQNQNVYKPFYKTHTDYTLVQFTMPVLDFKINHQHQQFKGLKIGNQNQVVHGKNFKIVENINLRMDQKGVVIEEQCWIGKDQCAVSGNIQIIVNQPFWIVLSEEGKHPYFVAKINVLPQKFFKQQEQQIKS